MSETTFNISWKALPRERSNGDLIVYGVKHTKKLKGGVTCTPEYQNTTETFVTLLHLTSCSQYSVDVRAYTSAGPGPFGALPSEIVTNGRYYWCVEIVTSGRYNICKIGGQQLPVSSVARR